MTEPALDTAADELLAEIAKAGGLHWVESLQAFHLKGSLVPEKHLVRNLWQRGLLRSDGHDLVAEKA
jgi:hypothetical protein